MTRSFLRCVTVLGLSLWLVSATAAQAIIYGGVGGRPAHSDPNNPRTTDAFVFSLSPGQSKDDAITVVNNSAEPKVLMVYAADFSPASEGGYACSGLFDVQKELGSWVSFASSFQLGKAKGKATADDDGDGLTNEQEAALGTDPTLADTDGDGGTDKQEVDLHLNPLQPVLLTLGAGETHELPFTITVPTDIGVGEHNGCIFVQEKKPNTTEQGISLSVRSGVRVFLTVPGDITHSIKIKSFTRRLSNAGLTVLHPAVQNTGNASVEADVQVKTKNIFGVVAQQHGGKYTITRGNTSEWNFELARQWWGGWFRSSLDVSYYPDPESQPGKPVGAATTLVGPVLSYWLMPSMGAWMVYSGVLLLILIALFLLWLVWKRRTLIRRTWKSYTVKRGETLQSLAKRWNISWKLLAKVNHLKAPYELKTGQKIQAPPVSAAKKPAKPIGPKTRRSAARRSTIIALFMLLLGSVIFSIFRFAYATTPNPGHSITEVDWPVVTKTGNATLTDSERVVLADATTAAFTLTLPTAVQSAPYAVFQIKKIDSALANIVTIDANGSETIDGMLTITLANRGETVFLQSDGSNWRVMARRAYDVSGYRAKGSTLNQWYTSPNNGTALTTGAGTVNVLRAIPFLVSKVTTIDQMAVNVTTAGAGGTGNARVGIYSDNGNLYPGALVVDAGAQVTTSTGVKTYTTGLPVTLDPGLYWLAYVHDNATTAPTMRAFAVGSLNPVLGYASTLPTTASLGWSVNFTYAALPNPFTAGGAVITAVPIWAVFVRTST